jgi:predicted transcriptional regulator
LGEHNRASVAETLGITPAMVQGYEGYAINAKNLSNADDGAVANYIEKLEETFAAKEITDGVPEKEQIAPLFEHKRWKELPAYAPQKSNAEAVVARRNAKDGLPPR